MGHHYLPSDSLDEANKLIAQSIAIIDLLGRGGRIAQNKSTLSDAAWALEEMQLQLKQIINSEVEV